MNSRIFLATCILLFSASFFSSEMFGQTYQRTFPSDQRSTFTVCNTATSGGGFYLVGVYDDAMGNAALTVSRHDPKGEVMWGADYEIADVGYAIGVKTIEATTLAGDTLVITALNAATVNLSDEKFILVCEPNAGNVVWSTVIEDTEGDLPAAITGYVNVERDALGDINYFGAHNLNDLSGVHFEKIGSDQSTKVSKSYFAYNQDTLASNLSYFDSAITQDTGFLVVAAIEGNENAVLKLDNQGNVLRSTKYNPTGVEDGFLELNAIAETRDSGFVASGVYLEVDTVAMTNTLFTVLMKADAQGNVEWTREINMLDILGGFLLINQSIDLIVTNNNEILVAGKAIDIVGGGVGDYTIFFDQAGNVVRQFIYGGGFSFWIDGASGFQMNLMDLSQTSDGNILMTTSGIDFGFNRFVPIVVKMDQMGDAFCQDTLPVNSTLDFTMVSDTLLVGDTLMTRRKPLEVEHSVFAEYSVPVVMLSDTTFCPQDPIIYMMDATTQGAIGYEWSTGDTTAAVTVFEEGDYNVTVTMDDRICYTLCDTVTVSQQDFPVANTQIIDRFCQFREYRLGVSSTTDVASVIWSTGDTDQSIIAPAEPGTIYTVTITDSCDNTAEATATIPESPTQETSIIVDASGLCTNGVIVLNASSTSTDAPFEYLWSDGSTGSGLEVTEPGGTFSVTLTDGCDLIDSATVTIPASDFEIPDPDVTITNNIGVNPATCEIVIIADGVAGSSSLQIVSYQWSNGTGTQENSVGEAGTYTVTVTDNCGQTDEASVTISESDLEEGSPMNGPIVVNDEDCVHTYTAQVKQDGRTVSYQWSNGEVTREIMVSVPGTYTVTVTDNCGNTDEASATRGPEAPDFPNIFFPGSQDIERNRAFGPNISCPEITDIEGYTLEVYNRWGKRVFMSDRIIDRWNGRNANAGAVLQEDVYLWQAFWTDNEGAKEDKGHITLAKNR